MRAHSLFAALILACVCAAPARAQQPAGDPAQVIIHMLDYIGVDYAGAVENGKVKNTDEFKEMQDFAAQVTHQLKTLPARAQQPALVKDAQRLAARVNAAAPADEIAKLSGDLRRAIVQAYDVAVAPQRAPDLQQAANRYAAACGRCHGAQGRGDGPAAQRMEPPPANFHDVERMRSRSVYGLYSTITLGVAGTPMTSFASLPENDRWALAFYIANMAADGQAVKRGSELWRQGVGRNEFASLRDLTSLSPNEMQERYGAAVAAVLPYLLSRPSAVVATQANPLDTSRRLLRESVAAYQRGDRDAAQRLAVSSYLEGFELAEAGLDARDAKLRVEIENEMIGLRSAMRANAPASQVTQQVEKISDLLDRAAMALAGEVLSPGTTAVSAFVILLREGLEAILVLAAVLAFLEKAGRRDAMRWVHAGWIAALALGLVTWFAASYVIAISGAGRELTEGVTALIAAAVLLYVGYWLHGKAYAQAWQRYIREKLFGALSQGTLWALAFVSFLAVYREVFETVLFYEALWTQAGEAGAVPVIGGFAAAALVLVTISWLVFRYGVRLPIGPFFAASSVLLAVLAVVFVGQGVAALQEAGYVAADLVAFTRIPSLGVFPTAQSLGAQAVALALVLATFAWSYIAAKRSGRNTFVAPANAGK